MTCSGRDVFTFKNIRELSLNGKVIAVADPDVMPKEKVVHAYENEKVTLWCDAERNPADFTWLKNNEFESYKSRRRYKKVEGVDEVSGNPFLIYWNVHRNNNGTYECRTEDNNGRNTSSRVSLIVYAKPDIGGVDISQDVGPNGFLLQWTVHEGNSPVKYYSIQHIKNDTGPWQDTVKIFRAVDFRYLITDLDESTEYEFRMTATNSVGVSTPVRWSWRSSKMSEGKSHRIFQLPFT